MAIVTKYLKYAGIAVLVVIVPFVFLYAVLPLFGEDSPDVLFYTEVFLAGLLSGVMYSLVAIGFVLIF